MQKRFLISLSSVLFTLPLLADNVELDRGFVLTKECLEKGEFVDCPRDQLEKISANNPLMLYQHSEGKTYILDVTELQKNKWVDGVFKNGIVVKGMLQEDQKTIKVTDIYKPMPRKSLYRTTGI